MAPQSKEPRSQRTEKPTARRLKKARQQGQVARSPEIPTTLVLVAFLVFGHLVGPTWLGQLRELMATVLGQLHRPDLSPSGLPAFLNAAIFSTGMLLAPPLGALAAAGIVGNLIQGPPPLTLHPLKPRLGKINPFQGIKKVVSLKQWVEMLKGLLKMALYGAVAYTAAREVILENPARSPGPEGTLQMLSSLAGTVILRVAAAAAGLAVLDYLFRRYEHTRSLKMSKKEVRDEHKEVEGDPTVRARVRQKQTALARTRMMADVPNATVVVTNPTHVAIALRYVPGESEAPRVLAKGRALVADRIRTVAAAHGIPIVSDPPLARALYRSAAVGALIPPVLFKAVAEILAMVLSRQSPRSEAPRPVDDVRP